MLCRRPRLDSTLRTADLHRHVRSALPARQVPWRKRSAFPRPTSTEWRAAAKHARRTRPAASVPRRRDSANVQKDTGTATPEPRVSSVSLVLRSAQEMRSWVVCAVRLTLLWVRTTAASHVRRTRSKLADAICLARQAQSPRCAQIVHDPHIQQSVVSPSPPVGIQNPWLPA